MVTSLSHFKTVARMASKGETDEQRGQLDGASIHTADSGFQSSLSSLSLDDRTVTEACASGDASHGSIIQAGLTESDAVPCGLASRVDLREGVSSSTRNEIQTLSEIIASRSRQELQPSSSSSPSSRQEYHQAPVEQAEAFTQETASSTDPQSRTERIFVEINENTLNNASMPEINQFLIERMNPDFGILDKLLTLKALSRAEREEVKKLSTSYAKNTRLLELVTKNEKITEFFNALKDTHQEHLVNYVTAKGEYSHDYAGAWPLTERETSILDVNQEALIDLLNFSGNEIVFKLYSLSVLNQRQKDFICEQSYSCEKAEVLLSFLYRSSLNDYRKMIACLIATNQQRVARLLSSHGGAAVRIHNALGGETEETLSAAENEIVAAIENILSNMNPNVSNRIRERLQLNFFAACVGHSVNLYILCETMDELMHLSNLLTSGELWRGIETLFNQLVSGSKKIHVFTTVSEETLEKCKKFLEEMDKTDAKPLRESKSGSSTSLKEKSTSGETRMKNAAYPVQETSIPDSGLLSMGNVFLRSGSQGDVQNLPKTRNIGMGSMGDSGFISNFSGASSLNSQHTLSHSLQGGLTIADTEIDTENYYKMNHPKRGHCMIINNTLFKKETRMDERKGSDVDAANVYQLFRKLGFEVDLKNNQTTVQMLQHVIHIASQNHADCDCLVIVLLSHGDDGIVYGTDGFLRFDDLIAPLKGTGCKTLAGKPKLFFIQACRGTNLDDGVDVTDAVPDSDKPEDEEKKTYKIPAEADFLYAYSSPAGQFSFRNNAHGSWFIQALCKVFEEHSKDKEIMQMLTRVNRHVALQFESRSRKKEHSGKKQVPSIVSMLTKELFFRTK